MIRILSPVALRRTTAACAVASIVLLTNATLSFADVVDTYAFSIPSTNFSDGPGGTIGTTLNLTGATVTYDATTNTFSASPLTAIGLNGGTFDYTGSPYTILRYASTTNSNGIAIDVQGFVPGQATNGIEEEELDAEGTTFHENGTAGELVLQVAASAPEPSTWAMMILGFCGLGYMAYRQKKAGPALAAA